MSHQGQNVAQDDGVLETVHSKLNMNFEQYRKAENVILYRFSSSVSGVTSDYTSLRSRNLGCMDFERL